MLRTAAFESANGYTTEGRARIVTDGNGHVLELLEDFRTSAGGVLDVRLCRSAACGASDLDLGRIQSRQGRQIYALPGPAQEYSHVVIWCTVVSLPFGFGVLR